MCKLFAGVVMVVKASSWPLVRLVCLSVCPLVSLHHMIFFTSNQSQSWESHITCNLKCLYQVSWSRSLVNLPLFAR